MRLFVALLLILPSQVALAQAQYATALPKALIILQSTRDYPAALAGAKQAAAQLKRPLKLDGESPNKAIGLSASQIECEKSGCRYPCYWPRGQDLTETSDYISIEFSTSYQGLAKGYYIVVAASAPPNSVALRQALARVQCTYPTAYAKRTAVGLGCMQ